MATDSHKTFVATLEKTHGASLRRFVAWRLRTAAADVPDIVQEVFLRLLRIDNHEAIRNSQAYLYTVASHVLRQHAIRQAAMAEPVDVTDMASELELGQSDPAMELELEQRYEALAEGLKLHSPRAYATLILHRCHELPLQEISERIGVSYSMTKKYLAKALKYLDNELEKSKDAP